MKRMPLTRGFFALVDDEDFSKISSFKWCAVTSKKSKNIYAKRKTSRPEQRTIIMHRVIMEVTDPKIQVDHKNHDGLDNRKNNLRLATNAQNNRNRSGANRNSKTGMRGVSWHPVGKKWGAYIKINGKTRYLGLFSTIEQASLAYMKANKEIFGDFGGAP